MGKAKSTGLRLCTRSSYLIASWVGSGPSQYQCMVFGFTNLAQVLSSGVVFLQIFSRKLNSSRLTCGRLLPAEKDDQNIYIKMDGHERYYKIRMGAYAIDLSLPRLYQQACTPSPLDGSSICHPPGRSSDSSSLYLSLGSQRSPSTRGSD